MRDMIKGESLLGICSALCIKDVPGKVRIPSENFSPAISKCLTEAGTSWRKRKFILTQIDISGYFNLH